MNMPHKPSPKFQTYSNSEWPELVDIEGGGKLTQIKTKSDRKS